MGKIILPIFAGLTSCCAMLIFALAVTPKKSAATSIAQYDDTGQIQGQLTEISEFNEKFSLCRVIVGNRPSESYKAFYLNKNGLKQGDEVNLMIASYDIENIPEGYSNPLEKYRVYPTERQALASKLHLLPTAIFSIVSHDTNLIPKAGAGEYDVKETYKFQKVTDSAEENPHTAIFLNNRLVEYDGFPPEN